MHFKYILPLLMVALASSCASNTSKKTSYSCYSDFTKIGKERLAQNKKNRIKTAEVVQTIQDNQGVDFDRAIAILTQFKGNTETISIDQKIAAIDSKSKKLNNLVKPHSGESACNERMQLETERAKLSDAKFLALNQAFKKQKKSKRFVRVDENYKVIEKNGVNYIFNTYIVMFEQPYYITVERKDGLKVDLNTVEKMAIEYIKPRGCTTPLERRKDLDRHNKDMTKLVIGVAC